MFQSATLKLTAIYLAILMSISLAFSVVVYNLSVTQFERRINSPEQVLRRFPRIEAEELEEILRSQSEEAQRALRAQLLITNLAILVLGGGLSYVLAKKTLEPIEKAHESQGRFVSDASHELRTPLAVMQSEIEVALRAKKITVAQAKELLNSNLEEIAKLRDLSQALLELTRAEHTLDLTPTKAKTIVELAVQRVAKGADLKHITIETSSCDQTIAVHEVSAVEALVIVLDNAIKYSPEKSKVTINCKPNNRWLDISIADQGMGIKASDQAHIFETFYRADQSRNIDVVDGFGLGLPLAKRIMNQHGGEIYLKSEFNGGSVFTLRFKISN